ATEAFSFAVALNDSAIAPRSRSPSTQTGLFPLGAPELFQIDDHVGHGCEFRCLRYEEFLRVAADAQHFALHGHEHPLALRIEWPVGLIGEERLITTPRVMS